MEGWIIIGLFHLWFGCFCAGYLKSGWSWPVAVLGSMVLMPLASIFVAYGLFANGMHMARREEQLNEMRKTLSVALAKAANKPKSPPPMPWN